MERRKEAEEAEGREESRRGRKDVGEARRRTGRGKD